MEHIPELSKEARSIKVGGNYRHFKGHEIEVIGIAHHSETLEEMVMYRHFGKSSMGENDLWVRPLKMFLENVERNDYKGPRFKLLP